MSNQNGLFSSRDVASTGDVDSNFFIRKGDPVVIDDLVANNITCDTLDLNDGLLTTTSGGTILTLNGVPVAGGIDVVNGTAPISVVTTGATAVVSLNNSGVVPGTYPLADVTVNAKGLIATINAGTIPPNDDWSNFPAQSAVNMNGFKITTLATATAGGDATNKTYVDGAITTASAGFVNLLTNQTIGGIKTFTSIPVCATMPTNNNQLANKQYVDSAVSADALSNVLIAGNSAGANQINMNSNKIINCLNPTNPQDVATKNYVDTTAGSGVYLPLAGGTMAGSSATINMNGADITNAGSVTAGGITETAQFGSVITPMFAFGAYATDISIGHYNPLTSMTLSSANDINITATEDINLQSKDINLTQSDIASFMNLTATGGIVIGAGLGIDLTGGTTIQINSAGNVSIGSGNVLGADTEIEKIAFKDNAIYKVAGNADITIEDVASITNVGAAPNGAMLIQAEQNLTLNSTAGVVIVEGISVSGTTIAGSSVAIAPSANTNASITTTGTGAINLSSASGNINLTTTGATADINFTAEDAITATCKAAFTAGSTLGLTTIRGNNTNITANANGGVNLITTGSGDVAVNSQNFFTAVSNNFDLSNQALTINSATATGQAIPILKLVNTNTTGGTTNPVVIQTVKNDASPTAGDVIAEITARGTINTAALQDYTRIQSIAQNIGGTAAGIDGTMNFQCITNGVYNTYLTLNGSSQQINAGKALLMNNNDVLSIKDVGLQTGGLGLVGQSLVSGQGLGSRWNYNMASVSNVGTGGANTLNAGSFADIAGGLAIPLTASGFVASPINKYKVSAWGTFSGVNDSVRMYMTIQANGTGAIATGDTFNSGSDLYYYTQDINFGGGSHFTTFSFSDVFTCVLNIGGTATVNLWVECSSGTHTITNNRHQFSLEPIFTP